MSLKQLPKMTVRQFEEKLFETFKTGQWTARKVTEESNKLTLYYNNGNHVGTWMKTKCFIAE